MSTVRHLLAFDIVPAHVAAAVCATLMLIARAWTLRQLYRSVDWNACILLGGLIPPATAMTNTGAATLCGDCVASSLASAGPHAVLAKIFLIPSAIIQLISDTSSAPFVMPIGLSTGSKLGISALPLMFGVARATTASFLTPLASGLSLMVDGPGGIGSAIFGHSASSSSPGRWPCHRHGLGDDRDSERDSFILVIPTTRGAAINGAAPAIPAH